MKAQDIERGAVISEDGLYRYELTRRWGEPMAGSVCWIMLNPSTADAAKDDPTVRRCMVFSDGWGYDALTVVNLFAWRATKPVDLMRSRSPVGQRNDDVILSCARRSAITVAAWGNRGTWLGRSGEVRQMLMTAGVPLYCLDRGSDGQPKHPLYLPADCTLARLD